MPPDRLLLPAQGMQGPEPRLHARSWSALRPSAPLPCLLSAPGTLTNACIT